MTSRADIASLLKLGKSLTYPILVISFPGTPHSPFLQDVLVLKVPDDVSPPLLPVCRSADEFIDLVIPRGSGELVKYIKVVQCSVCVCVCIGLSAAI